MTNVGRNAFVIKGINEGLKDGSFYNSDEVKILLIVDISQSLASIADSLEKLVSAQK